jgi:hypothetical protein
MYHYSTGDFLSILSSGSVWITPKAFANFSPGFEHRENPGLQNENFSTLKGFGGWRTLSGFNQKMFG